MLSASQLLELAVFAVAGALAVGGNLAVYVLMRRNGSVIPFFAGGMASLLYFFEQPPHKTRLLTVLATASLVGLVAAVWLGLRMQSF